VTIGDADNPEEAGPKMATRHCAEEEKMAAPPCPQPQDFSVLSGFITPGSDFPPPHPLDASITVAVLDPTENDEPIRIAETTDPFAVQVEWCICGPLAAGLCGCWNVSVYIDDIDGVGPTHGQLGATRTVQVDIVPLTRVPPESSRRCYKLRFDFPAGTVGAGVYNLVVVITLRTGSCANPGPRLGDTLGYATIPVLVFFED
jgi:hypothetical protein